MARSLYILAALLILVGIGVVIYNIVNNDNEQAAELALPTLTAQPVSEVPTPVLVMSPSPNPAASTSVPKEVVTQSTGTSSSSSTSSTNSNGPKVVVNSSKLPSNGPEDLLYLGFPLIGAIPFYKNQLARRRLKKSYLDIQS